MPIRASTAFAKTPHGAPASPFPFPLLGLAALLTLGLGACERAFVNEVDIDLPDNERQLVVEAYVRPDDTSFVYVSRTQDINAERDLGLVAGATVTLSVDGREAARFTERRVDGGARFGFGEEDGVPEYFAVVDEALFVVGAAFTLAVEAPGGDRATATQPVPGGGTLTDVTVRALDFETRLGFTARPGAGAADFLLTGDAIDYRGRDFDTLGNPGRFDTTYSPLRFSTGEDFDYVGYGERFPVQTAAASPRATVVNISDRSFPGCPAGDDDCTPEPRLRLRLTGLNPLAADYFEALQQIEQTDGNPFVEPVALPSAFEGARGMLVVESRVEEVVVAL